MLAFPQTELGFLTRQRWSSYRRVWSERYEPWFTVAILMTVHFSPSCCCACQTCAPSIPCTQTSCSTSTSTHERPAAMIAHKENDFHFAEHFTISVISLVETALQKQLCMIERTGTRKGGCFNWPETWSALLSKLYSMTQCPNLNFLKSTSNTFPTDMDFKKSQFPIHIMTNQLLYCIRNQPNVWCPVWIIFTCFFVFV